MSGVVSIKDGLAIPASELKFKYVRSSGPGGQNVNKLNTKAVLSWSLYSSRALSESQKERILTKLGAKISEEGNLVLLSARFRSRERNKADCIEKFSAMIRKALSRPKPRKKTRKSRASVEKRLSLKKKQSDKKRLRGKIDS